MKVKEVPPEGVPVLLNSKVANSNSPLGGLATSAGDNPNTIVTTPFAFASATFVTIIWFFKGPVAATGADKLSLVLSNEISTETNPINSEPELSIIL